MVHDASFYLQIVRIADGVLPPLGLKINEKFKNQGGT